MFLRNQRKDAICNRGKGGEYYPDILAHQIIESLLLLLVCQCCCNTTQNEWLKAAGIYCLAVLETRSLTSKCWQGCTPANGTREGFVPGCSLSFEYIVPCVWQHNSNLHIAISLCVGLCLNFPFLQDISHIRLEPILMT